MSQVQGHCDPKFNEVKTLLQKFIDSNEECGAAIAVNLDGKDIIDIWGGHKDEAHTEPWQRDTIVNVWSSTKTVLCLSALMAIDRGLITPDTKIASIWPEFGVNGKQDIELRMFMSHTSGVSGWDAPLPLEDFYDTPKATALLAAQTPWWKPGTASGYHSTSQGFLIGEVIRRTTGKTLTQFVADEIAQPLGADFQIGCRENDWPRVAPVIPPTDPFPPMDPDSLSFRTLLNPALPAAQMNTPAARRAELGAINGHTNARALVKILSSIPLGGTVDGHTLLSQETINLIFNQQSFGTDLVLGIPIRFGIGFGLAHRESAVDWMPEGRICFWSGWGGSLVLMDVGRRLTFAYTMNRMGGGTLGNERTMGYLRAVYRCLGVGV